MHHLFSSNEISNIRVAEDEREQVEERDSSASAFLLRYVNLVAIRQHSRCDSARTREFAGKLTSYIHTRSTQTHTFASVALTMPEVFPLRIRTLFSSASHRAFVGSENLILEDILVGLRKLISSRSLAIKLTHKSKSRWTKTSFLEYLNLTKLIKFRHHDVVASSAARLEIWIFANESNSSNQYSYARVTSEFRQRQRHRNRYRHSPQPFDVLNYFHRSNRTCVWPRLCENLGKNAADCHEPMRECDPNEIRGDPFVTEECQSFISIIEIKPVTRTEFTSRNYDPVFRRETRKAITCVTIFEFLTLNIFQMRRRSRC